MQTERASTVDFAILIAKDRQHDEWSGTLLAYLNRVKKHPSLADLALIRMYGVIVGESVADLSGDSRAKRLFSERGVKV